MTDPNKILDENGERTDLVGAIGREVRRMGGQSVITSQVVATRFGLHTTDLECLDILYLRKTASAGELSAATGLTSGAMTALIDRLERAGYVERTADPGDRRKVLVRIRPEAVAPIKAVYEPMQKRMFELWSHYRVAEQAVIVDFLRRSTDLAVTCVREMRGEEPVAKPAKKAS